MKKLIVSVIAAALAFGLEAAQCQGLTKEGVRCKREAAENSKYCIGHADQAKAAPKAEAKAEKPKAPAAAEKKLEDDGTCWAATEKGTRCKHKKVGESDYCAQHAADRKPAGPVKQCRAFKWDGKQCERAPEENCYYCAQHRKLGAAKAARPAPAKAK